MKIKGEPESMSEYTRKLPTVKLPVFDENDPIGSLEELYMVTHILNLPHKYTIMLFMQNNLRLMTRATESQKQNIDEFRNYLLGSLGLLDQQTILNTLGTIKQAGRSGLEFLQKIETIYKTFINKGLEYVLNESDKIQLKVYFINGLDDPQISRQLKLENVDYSNLVTR